MMCLISFIGDVRLIGFIGDVRLDSLDSLGTDSFDIIPLLIGDVPVSAHFLKVLKHNMNRILSNQLNNK